VNASEVNPNPVVPSPPRRNYSVKEPPAFKWKIAGYVNGLTVTLLKAVERDEVEAQLERLQAEGYYRGVDIYPIEAKVPPDPLAARFAREEKAARRLAAPKPTRKPAKAVTAKAPVPKPKLKPKPLKPSLRKTARGKVAPKPPATPKRAAKPPSTAPKAKMAQEKRASKKK
jgi:hypothetical protein